MSQHNRSGPEQGGTWEPAYPPVQIVEGEDLVERADQAAGLSKLEWATIMLVSGNVRDLPGRYSAELDEGFARDVVALAHRLLTRARDVADAELESQRQAAGELHADEGRPLHPPALDDLAELGAKLATDAMQYLCDTHQLGEFMTWHQEHGRGEMVDLATFPVCDYGDATPPHTKGA